MPRGADRNARAVRARSRRHRARTRAAARDRPVRRRSGGRRGGQSRAGVEAAEGTDGMLARIAELRAQGRIPTPAGVGVLVKAPKPGQDRRFDLPTIGPKTVDGGRARRARRHRGRGGKRDRRGAGRVARAADRAKIFVLGVRGSEPQ